MFPLFGRELWWVLGASSHNIEVLHLPNVLCYTALFHSIPFIAPHRMSVPRWNEKLHTKTTNNLRTCKRACEFKSNMCMMKVGKNPMHNYLFYIIINFVNVTPITHVRPLTGLAQGIDRQKSKNGHRLPSNAELKEPYLSNLLVNFGYRISKWNYKKKNSETRKNTMGWQSEEHAPIVCYLVHCIIWKKGREETCVCVTGRRSLLQFVG